MHIGSASISVSHLILPIIGGGRTGDDAGTSDWLEPELTPNSAALRATVGEQNSRHNSESHISARGPSADPEVGEAALLESDFCHFIPPPHPPTPFQRGLKVRRIRGKFFFLGGGISRLISGVAAGAPESVSQFAQRQHDFFF